MKKTVILTVIVDDVDLEDLSDLAENINAVFDDYKWKRIDMSLSDSPMVRPVTPPQLG